MLSHQNEPVIYVERKRTLSDGRVVLSGPSLFRSFLQCEDSTSEVYLTDPSSAKESN